MEVSISGQLSVFFYMLLGGAASGMLSDLFYTLRNYWMHRRWSIGLADLLLWVLLAAGIFALNLYVNNGELRWHALLGLLLGAVLYFLTLSAIVRWILHWIFKVFVKIVRFILKIVLTTAAFLYKIIQGIFRFFARLFAPAGRLAKRCGKTMGEKVRREFLKTRLVFKKK